MANIGNFVIIFNTFNLTRVSFEVHAHPCILQSLIVGIFSFEVADQCVLLKFEFQGFFS
eukprot:07855.XXX_181400_181573_1 [CDS] Oithona nana genome sequencing.